MHVLAVFMWQRHVRVSHQVDVRSWKQLICIEGMDPEEHCVPIVTRTVGTPCPQFKYLAKTCLERLHRILDDSMYCQALSISGNTLKIAGGLMCLQPAHISANDIKNQRHY